MNILEKLQAAADKNGDGTISAGDLTSFMESAPAPLQDSLQQLKDQADHSGDGKIDFSDAQSLLENTSGGFLENIQKIFGK